VFIIFPREEALLYCLCILITANIPSGPPTKLNYVLQATVDKHITYPKENWVDASPRFFSFAVQLSGRIEFPVDGNERD